jgi:GNAT superfamily N-acetyltransferase
MLNPSRTREDTPVTVFADMPLAARLEGLCAEEMRRFVETAALMDPASGATALTVGGGIAAFVGVGSPVNQAFGLGFAGPVAAEEIARLEEFYTSRAARPLVGLCPLAHPSLLASLSGRGWVADGFENVLVRPLFAKDRSASRLPEGIEIREVCDEDDRELWVLVAATGFSAPLPPFAEQLALGQIVVRRPGSRLFLALVDGEVAGTGELHVADGVAWLSADATLPRFRRRGVQQALQRHRLALGAEASCEIAVTESAPGGTSQRNMERAGFRVVYTRVDLVWGQLGEDESA